MKDKRELERKELTEQQELLLCRYFDDECGWIGSFRARGLLRKSCSAKDFFSGLRATSLETRDCGDMLLERASRSTCCENLWEKVSARIASEEKAEIFLGKRSVASSQQAFFTLPRFAWGVSGAAAALCLVAAFSLDGFSGAPSEPTFESSIASLESPIRTDGSEAGGVTLASRGIVEPVRQVSTASGAGSQPLRNFVEVDWMKSDGSVRLVHDPAASAPIIVVKKRPFDTLYPSGRSGTRALYRSRARVPAATLFANE
ncbi:MAG: hypothetical protein KDD64_04090 [Bdellovibrionales bacterium]|nr:hypothetical protein [Bdellovibrionales bacterium]